VEELQAGGAPAGLLQFSIFQESIMRRSSLVLALAAALCAGGASAQYQAQQTPPGLYPYQKNQLPPGGYYDNAPGIPTSGIEQGRQLESNQPQNQRSGPTVYHRNYDRKGSTTVITGPNGTTVCTDSYGKRSTTGVCF
jgi:hypothetical protein